jgi:predicted porin
MKKKSNRLPLFNLSASVPCTLLAGPLLLLAPAVSAQITMYGIADAGLSGTSRGGTTSTATQVMSGIQSTSRWGVRGTEDLGGNLKAIFNLEGQINFDEGTGASAGAFNFARRAFVGLDGSWGQVYIGRDYTPGYWVASTADTFRYGLWGSTVVFSGAVAGLTSRSSNAVFYKSPNLGGAEIRFMYATGERDTVPKDGGNVVGLGATWASGPAIAGIYYHSLKVLASATATTSTTTKQFGLGGGWNFGAIRLNAGYGASDPEGASNTLSHVYLGTGIKLGSGEFLLQGIQLKQQTNNAKGTTLGLAYTYPMSKRTNLYITAGRTANNSVATFALNNAANTLTPTAAGEDPKAFGFGVRHTF